MVRITLVSQYFSCHFCMYNLVVYLTVLFHPHGEEAVHDTINQKQGTWSCDSCLDNLRFDMQFILYPLFIFCSLYFKESGRYQIIQICRSSSWRSGRWSASGTPRSLAGHTKSSAMSPQRYTSLFVSLPPTPLIPEGIWLLSPRAYPCFGSLIHDLSFVGGQANGVANGVFGSGWIYFKHKSCIQRAARIGQGYTG